jgi:hypothetical protein
MLAIHVGHRIARSPGSVLVGALNRVAIQPLQHIRSAVEHPTAVLDELRTGALVAILGESGGRGAEIFG